MNLSKLNVAFVLSLLVVPSFAFATTLTGFTAQPSNDGNWLNMSWSAADSATLETMDGYAIQWSDSLSDIHIEKPVKLYPESNSQIVRFRTFERGTDYYFRVYTYEKDGRDLILSNGSKALKWQLKTGGLIETSEVTITDPVIVNNSSSDSSTTDTDSLFNFGTMRVLPLDNFADISWSLPHKMAKGDYDGFQIVLSKKSDMSDPIKTFQTNRTKNTARLKGLTPNTQYYIRGEFHRGSRIFGAGDTKAFKTINGIDRSVSTRASRNLAKIEKKSYLTFTVGETEPTTTTTTTSISTTSTSTSSSTSSSTNTSLRTRIANLKKQISDLQADLRKLESQLSGSSTSTSSTSSTSTTTSTKKLSLRERLKLKLAQKRR